MTNDIWIATNRANWDDRARAHLSGDGEYYDLASVRAGKSTLLPLELELAGDVRGRRLLHLMCHIGVDSISWARLGAQVTAIDLSPVAINAARDLSTEAEVEIDFHVGDVYSLPEVCPLTFDIAVMTYGVLAWISDLPVLMQLVADRLEPGGRFVLVDGHPLTHLWPYGSALGDACNERANYFTERSPSRFDKARSYGGGSELSNFTSYQWQHHTAELVQAVIDSGLRLRTIREEAFGFYQRYRGMTRRTDGYLDLPCDAPQLPLLLALMAERP